jgi:hypothetical protein
MKASERDPTIHVNITLSISDVPSTQSEQFIYFNNLKAAIQTVLNLSAHWSIGVSVIEASIGRRSGQFTDLAVNIVFSSTSASPRESEQLQKMLASPAFLDGLSAMGFKVSRYGVPSIQGDPKLSSESATPSALTVGLSSSFGVAIGLTVLLCAYRAFARGKFQPYAGKNSEKLSSESDKSGREYSVEYDEVLQLMGRLNISISWLVDAYLRQVVEARIEDCQDISTHDRAAGLQLISVLELKESLDDQPSDRKMLLQKRVAEGPLTEIHSLILRQICRPETFESVLWKKVSSAESPHERFKLVNEAPTADESDVTDGPSTTAASRYSIQDVLSLLKSCDLDPCQLMDTESRRLMEEILTTRQEPLQAVHLAVLQLISKAEIDSDLCMDPMRRQLLEQRIKEGPLHAGHLRAARSLKMLGVLARVDPAADPPKLAAEIAESGDGSAASVRQAGSRDAASSSGVAHAPRPQEPLVACSSELVLLAPDGAASPVEIQRSPFVRDSIFGLEVQASVQSAREQSALALVELRAKTANIRRSLPEWVRGSLMPPQAPPPTSPMLLVQVDAEPADDAVPREAVQISCEVTADLGFFSLFSLYLSLPLPLSLSLPFSLAPPPLFL